MKSGLNSPIVVNRSLICSRVSPPTMAEDTAATDQPKDSAARTQLWSKKYPVSRTSSRVLP